ncbi:DEAD-box ATP-dependent RNA helicase 20-like [Dorcoceras hygrometricum]|uniref:DEAD-box ATP-dependent RNA helicase 20-like n=1 Tax=Dorcoceras hygrometricum TaxID=472368 RepID=A0A2Z7DHC2_9LAMI|nr:DEAD-box ATP-dependent RNA helicase 20-like [Dorcoceras hygrometricum]
MRKLLLTNLLAVATISTVDESIDSRYPRSKKLRRCADEAGVMKISWSVLFASYRRSKDAAVERMISSEAVDNLRSIIKDGCQLTEAQFEMAKATRSLQKKRTQFWKLSNGKKFYRGYIIEATPIEEVDWRVFVQLRDDVGASTYCVSHTVAAVVHLRSLVVLTAAGCGIGSVHVVVRSNLLVEPSDVEEGEM